MRRLAVRAVDPVDADIDHGRARLDPVAADQLGPADRGEQQVGARGTAPAGRASSNARSSRSRSRRAAAAPAACRRCWSGRSPPRRARRASACTVFASITQPSGVHGTSAGRPRREPADIERMKAVDVLGGIDRGDHLLRDRSARGSGSCTRMPCTAGSALSRAISASSSASLAVVRQAVIERAHAGLDRPSCALLRDIDLARRIVADQHDREAGRDDRAPPASRATSAADARAQVRRDRLAVDDRRAHALSRPDDRLRAPPRAPDRRPRS